MSVRHFVPRVMPRAGQPPAGPLSRRGDRSAGNRTADPAQGTFTYNAAGRATTRTSGASTSTYTWGGSDQNELVSKTTAGDTTSYVYGRNDRNGVPMLQPITKNGQTSYIDYDPAGKQLTATGTAAASNPFRYTQGLLDEDTGWLKHGVRWRTTPLPATGPPKTRSARCSHPTPPADTRTWLVTRQTTSTRHCIDTLGKYGFAGFLAFDVTAEGEAASALLVGEAATAHAERRPIRRPMEERQDCGFPFCAGLRHRCGGGHFDRPRLDSLRRIASTGPGADPVQRPHVVALERYHSG
jgi:hypothetical protein